MRGLRGAAFIAASLSILAGCALHVAEPRSATGPDSGPDKLTKPGTRAIQGPVYRVRTADRVVFLTIDDGATRDPQLFDLLRRSGIKATFFLTDQYVRQGADFFRRGRDETGAVIENHTLSHPNLQGKEVEFQRREICETSDRYRRDFGRRPTLLRPPYGNFDKTTMRAAQDCGITHLVHWTAEIQKGRMTFASGRQLAAGDIVLMHFSPGFREDIAAFNEQANKSGLKPALLEDYLK